MISAALFAATLTGLAAVPAANAAGAATTGLHWRWPPTITSGVAFGVRSVNSCPAAPTPGDRVLVQVNLRYSKGASSGNVLPANSNGSWAGKITFVFSNTPSTGKLSAECEDFNGVLAIPYAYYKAHVVPIVVPPSTRG